MDILITFYDIWQRSHGRLLQDVFATSQKKVVAISILDQYKTSPRLKIRRFMDPFKTSFGQLGSYMLFKEWECCRYSHIYTCSNVLTVIESVQPKNNKSFDAPVQYQNDAFMFVKFSCQTECLLQNISNSFSYSTISV